MLGEVFVMFFFGYGLGAFVIQAGQLIWKAIQASMLIGWVLRHWRK